MNFETKLSGNTVSTYNVTKENHDTESSVIIEWSFVTEMRQWGVKSMYLYVNRVQAEVDLNLWSDDYELETTKHFLIDTDMTEFDNSKWAIEVDKSNLNFGDCVQPRDVELDFASKIINVIF